MTASSQAPDHHPPQDAAAAAGQAKAETIARNGAAEALIDDRPLLEAPSSIEQMKSHFQSASAQYKALGGWSGLRSGEWLTGLITGTFKGYWEQAGRDDPQRENSTLDKFAIARQLIAVAARNSAVLGMVTGAAISADEIVGIATLGEGGIGVPANLAIAAVALGSEALLLTRIQLRLIANLGRLLAVSLDADQPEDVLTILALGLGGGAAEEGGRLGMKIGASLLGQRAAKAALRKQVVSRLERGAAKIGARILQRGLLKYTVPLVSVGIGATWNYTSTRKVGKTALEHFERQLREAAALRAESLP